MRCTNETHAFSIGYPADWHTAHNNANDMCRRFDPEPFTIEPYGAAQAIGVSPSNRPYTGNVEGTGVEFLLNERADLAAIASGTIDLVYSYIVLQHIKPRFAKRYIQEFIRVLSPGGVAVFQIPSGPDGSAVGWLLRLIPRPLFDAYARTRYGPNRIEMHAIPVRRVRALVREVGGEVGPTVSVDDEPHRAARPRRRHDVAGTGRAKELADTLARAVLHRVGDVADGSDAHADRRVGAEAVAGVRIGVHDRSRRNVLTDSGEEPRRERVRGA